MRWGKVSVCLSFCLSVCLSQILPFGIKQLATLKYKLLPLQPGSRLPLPFPPARPRHLLPPRHLLLATLSRLSLLLPLGRPQHSLPPRHLLRVAMPTVRGLQGLSRGSTIENVVSVPARNRNAQMFQNKYICLFVDTLIVALGMQSLSLSFHVLAKDLRSAA